MDDIPDALARAAAIDGLLYWSAQRLLAGDDASQLIERLALAGPSLYPELTAEGAGARANPAAAPMFRALGWAIASAMPLPSNRFIPRKLPLPGRNDACLCGSARKFKHCCADVYAHLPSFEPLTLGAVMVCAMPRKQWGELPALRIPPDMVLAAAQSFCDEEAFQDACALLEPWAKRPAPWTAEVSDLLDVLADVYLDLDKPRKRKQLAQAMIDNGDATVQSFGWQRLSMMASDAGDAKGAKRAFDQAQRLTPDDPRIAVLEVTTLLGTGQESRARERAGFHARRLGRLPIAPEIAHTIDALEDMSRGEWHLAAGQGDEVLDDDVRALFGMDADVDSLLNWIDSLPEARLQLDWRHATADDLGALAPTKVAATAMRRWRQAMTQPEPQLTYSRLDDDQLQVFDAAAWLQALQRSPVLADCLDVLDALLLALDGGPAALTYRLESRVLERALALWNLILQRYPAARCEWAWMENRPALRHLVRRIELDTSAKADSSFEWLRAMVEVLNPNDNHGFRPRLAAVYLRRGMRSEALALCARYPDDFVVGITVAHARALLAVQRLDEAGRLLAEVHRRNPHVLPLLRGSRKPKVPDISSYAVGSVEEARVMVAEQFDLWRDDKGVRAWLAQWDETSPSSPANPSLFDEFRPD
ncbi:YecA family protein [Variovorax rhizosphaerae]|uniref:SEC-C metal-binding domain-containing protein n=1 Tax=Variovorax rhizosphaerae TaxID=1836200 RepID=A0ABU8WD84_9BURK